MYDKSDILYVSNLKRTIYLRRVFFVEEIIDTTFLDPTGTVLTPSYHGELCLGNGDHPGVECCCDECDFYLICFPDWNTLSL